MDSKCCWKFLFIAFLWLPIFYKKPIELLCSKLVEQCFINFPFYKENKQVQIAKYPTVFCSVDRLLEISVKSLLLFSPLISWTKVRKSLQIHTANSSSSVGLACHIFTFTVQKYSKSLKICWRNLTQSYCYELLWIHFRIYSQVISFSTMAMFAIFLL